MLYSAPRLVLTAVALLAACSPNRTIEAVRVLQDIQAGNRPSALKQATPRRQRASILFAVDGRERLADLYTPADGGARRRGSGAGPDAATAAMTTDRCLRLHAGAGEFRSRRSRSAGYAVAAGDGARCRTDCRRRAFPGRAGRDDPWRGRCLVCRGSGGPRPGPGRGRRRSIFLGDRRLLRSRRADHLRDDRFLSAACERPGAIASPKRTEVDIHADQCRSPRRP